MNDDEVDKLSMIFDSLRELRDEIVLRGEEIEEAENDMALARERMGDAEELASNAWNGLQDSLERVDSLIRLVEQYGLRLVPITPAEYKEEIV